MIAAPTELIRLTELRPPHMHVLAVDQGHPIEAFLEDGTPVLVTCVLERVAIFERPGREIQAEGRETMPKQWVRVDPIRLSWKREAARRGGRMQVHRCQSCGKTGGQTRFADPSAADCLSCEGNA